MHDESDRRLTELYRMSSEDPPARLDRAVMAQASQSLRRRTLLPSGNRWVAAGALAGIFIVAVLLVLPPQEEALTPQQPLSRQDADAPLADGEEAGQPPHERPQSPAPEAQRFDFYTELPEYTEQPETVPAAPVEERIPVIPPPLQPEAGPEARVAEPVPAFRPPPPQTAVSDSYLLQVAGYRSLAEAGKMKEKLEFMRLQVRMQPISGDAGQTFYRLSVGPYSDLEELKRVQTLLQRRGIESTRVPVR